MSVKHKGQCPFCNEIVQPKVIEENTIRRDKCLCTECSEIIYVCRSPGCQNYAKGGEHYDHELCPSCTSNIADIGKTTAVMGLISIAAKILTKAK